MNIIEAQMVVASNLDSAILCQKEELLSYIIHHKNNKKNNKLK